MDESTRALEDALRATKDSSGRLKTTFGLILDSLGITDTGQRRAISGTHGRYHVGPEGRFVKSCPLCLALLNQPHLTASVKQESATVPADPEPLSLLSLRSFAGSGASLQEISDHLQIPTWEIERFIWEAENQKWSDFQDTQKSAFAAKAKLSVSTKVLNGRQALPAREALAILGQTGIVQYREETHNSLTEEESTLLEQARKIQQMTTEELQNELQRITAVLSRPTGIHLTSNTVTIKEMTEEERKQYQELPLAVVYARNAEERNKV